MMKRHTSDEGYVLMPNGTRNDALFHDAILDNPEADRKLAEIAIKRAMARGMTEKDAKALYGVD